MIEKSRAIRLPSDNNDYSQASDSWLTFGNGRSYWSFFRYLFDLLRRLAKGSKSITGDEDERTSFANGSWRGEKFRDS